MTSMLEALNYKIDILASTDNFDAQQDIEEVKTFNPFSNGLYRKT